MPQTNEEVQTIEKDFATSGLPGCIGIMDSTAITYDAGLHGSINSLGEKRNAKVITNSKNNFFFIKSN